MHMSANWMVENTSSNDLSESCNLNLHWRNQRGWLKMVLHAAMQDGKTVIMVVSCEMFCIAASSLLMYISALQIGYSGRPLGDDVHFAVLHSAWCSSGSAAFIHVICVHVDANKDVESQADDVPLFTTKLEWLTFHASGLVLFSVSREKQQLCYQFCFSKNGILMWFLSKKQCFL